MKTYLLSTAAALALFGGMAAGAGEAAAAPSIVNFTLGSVSTTAYGGNNGLIINTAPGPEVPSSFSLTEGGPSQTLTVLQIWTPERFVNIFEDTSARAFSLTMNFTAPAPGFPASVGGGTFGSLMLGGILGLQSTGVGYLQWSQPSYDIPFTSTTGTGTLRISLEDEDFNRGRFRFLGTGLNPGPASGGYVDATFTLVDFTPVPEPASLALLGAGLLGLGLTRRRRAAAAA